MKRQHQEVQTPSWQDMNPSILSKIFSFLGVEDQLFGPPFVCQSWLSATLDTLFQNSKLDLRLMDRLDDKNLRFRFTHLLKLAINLYHGWVSIYFPSKHRLGYFATLYIAERTPRITSVVLPPQVCANMIPIFISALYWKNLRLFQARMNPDLGFLVISQLVDCCKNITELRIHGTVVMEREVSCIIEGFPRIQILDLSECVSSCGALEIALDGRLGWLKELNLLHCKFMGDDGKDIREDYLKLKEFRNKVLEKASGFTSLKKLRHCLVKVCPDCRDHGSLDPENLP
ncbi:uncharacterized protein LOC127791734 [Diospyros lotus]|uniref:uncharacterized protein LOC127791734 n=1 Tax=Diospyros lotus TaxID=55363 RepID=UPI00224E01FE|nr:uncharacterized protein LOC127791734 [Diospyros lotus]